MGNTLAALIKGGQGEKKIPFLSISATQYLNILYPVNEKRQNREACLKLVMEVGQPFV